MGRVVVWVWGVVTEWDGCRRRIGLLKEGGTGGIAGRAAVLAWSQHEGGSAAIWLALPANASTCCCACTKGLADWRSLALPVTSFHPLDAYVLCNLLPAAVPLQWAIRKKPGGWMEQNVYW